MKHWNEAEIQLLESEINEQNFVDFAGFPPYIRGREVLSRFPKIVRKNGFSDESFHMFKINFSDNWAEKLVQAHSVSRENQQKMAVNLSFSGENITDFMAFIRALRGLNYLLNREKLYIFLEIFESDLFFLPMILSCEIDVIFCDDFVKKMILKHKKNIYSQTIDAFGGDLFIEQKTEDFIKKYFNEF